MHLDKTSSANLLTHTGIKYWAMASNKYLLSFQLYVGKSEEVRQHKLGIEVVLNFISVLPNLPHYSDWRFVFWIFRVSREVKKMGKKSIFTTTCPELAFCKGNPFQRI